jgi:UDPglucose--hexose-1-phosphate uridylyltransferase
MDQHQLPHRRYNALTGDWILVSPHRTQRPWQGKQESAARHARPAHDAKCYLCPGNERAGGAKNPEYTATYVFTNDFAALLANGECSVTGGDLSRRQPVCGTCRVICFSPRHDLTLPEMPVDAIRSVVDLWAAQTEELGREYRWIQIFENKGDIMGCSNPHPHRQIWAGDFIPNEPAKEDRQQLAHWRERGSLLLIDYLKHEEEQNERIVIQNEHWPYSMGWHGAPSGIGDFTHWHLHAHFYPPLLRSATVKKFMVGYEMLAEAQRDLTAEQAAQTLRNQSEIHFKSSNS